MRIRRTNGKKAARDPAAKMKEVTRRQHRLLARINADPIPESLLHEYRYAANQFRKLGVAARERGITGIEAEARRETDETEIAVWNMRREFVQKTRPVEKEVRATLVDLSFLVRMKERIKKLVLPTILTSSISLFVLKMVDESKLQLSTILYQAIHTLLLIVGIVAVTKLYDRYIAKKMIAGKFDEKIEEAERAVEEIRKGIEEKARATLSAIRERIDSLKGRANED